MRTFPGHARDAEANRVMAWDRKGHIPILEMTANITPIFPPIFGFPPVSGRNLPLLGNSSGEMNKNGEQCR